MGESLDIGEPEPKFGQDPEIAVRLMWRSQALGNLGGVFEWTAHKANGLRREHRRSEPLSFSIQRYRLMLQTVGANGFVESPHQLAAVMGKKVPARHFPFLQGLIGVERVAE